MRSVSQSNPPLRLWHNLCVISNVDTLNVNTRHTLIIVPVTIKKHQISWTIYYLLWFSGKIQEHLGPVCVVGGGATRETRSPRCFLHFFFTIQGSPSPTYFLSLSPFNSSGLICLHSKCVFSSYFRACSLGFSKIFCPGASPGAQCHFSVWIHKRGFCVGSRIWWSLTVTDRSFQGGVSGVWYCYAGKCRIPSDPLTLSRHEQRDMPEQALALTFI